MSCASILELNNPWSQKKWYSHTNILESHNLRSYNGEVNQHLLAHVWVNMGQYEVWKEVAVCGSEVLIGTNFPFIDNLVDLAKTTQEESPIEIVNAVTRAQAQDDTTQ